MLLDLIFYVTHIIHTV